MGQFNGPPMQMGSIRGPPGNFNGPPGPFNGPPGNFNNGPPQSGNFNGPPPQSPDGSESRIFGGTRIGDSFVQEQN
ncbi:MAG: hypothetical protein EZS28_011199 [Streblomastix strix]|uniref:Uncharacterized protein n=1 Tax=Streblomastix strix TaxID=222440 RepID=A0A5J4WE81_9EUKA|nr:MAG: hypothetical protein EZS28_011199 [Streblomastix strix]